MKAGNDAARADTEPHAMKDSCCCVCILFECLAAGAFVRLLVQLACDLQDAAHCLAWPAEEWQEEAWAEDAWEADGSWSTGRVDSNPGMPKQRRHEKKAPEVYGKQVADQTQVEDLEVEDQKQVEDLELLEPVEDQKQVENLELVEPVKDLEQVEDLELAAPPVEQVQPAKPAAEHGLTWDAGRSTHEQVEVWS